MIFKYTYKEVFIEDIKHHDEILRKKGDIHTENVVFLNENDAKYKFFPIVKRVFINDKTKTLKIPGFVKIQTIKQNTSLAEKHFLSEAEMYLEKTIDLNKNNRKEKK